MNPLNRSFPTRHLEWFRVVGGSMGVREDHRAVTVVAEYARDTLDASFRILFAVMQPGSLLLDAVARIDWKDAVVTYESTLYKSMSKSTLSCLYREEQQAPGYKRGAPRGLVRGAHTVGILTCSTREAFEAVRAFLEKEMGFQLEAIQPNDSVTAQWRPPPFVPDATNEPEFAMTVWSPALDWIQPWWGWDMSRTWRLGMGRRRTRERLPMRTELEVENRQAEYIRSENKLAVCPDVLPAMYLVPPDEPPLALFRQQQQKQPKPPAHPQPLADALLDLASLPPVQGATLADFVERIEACTQLPTWQGRLGLHETMFQLFRDDTHLYMMQTMRPDDALDLTLQLSLLSSSAASSNTSLPSTTPSFASIVTRTDRNVFCSSNPPHTSAIAVDMSTIAPTSAASSSASLSSSASTAVPMGVATGAAASSSASLSSSSSTAVPMGVAMAAPWTLQFLHGTSPFRLRLNMLAGPPNDYKGKYVLQMDKYNAIVRLECLSKESAVRSHPATAMAMAIQQRLRDQYEHDWKSMPVLWIRNWTVDTAWNDVLMDFFHTTADHQLLAGWHESGQLPVEGEENKIRTDEAAGGVDQHTRFVQFVEREFVSKWPVEGTSASSTRMKEIRHDFALVQQFVFSNRLDIETLLMTCLKWDVSSPTLSMADVEILILCFLMIRMKWSAKQWIDELSRIAVPYRDKLPLAHGQSFAGHAHAIVVHVKQENHLVEQCIDNVHTRVWRRELWNKLLMRERNTNRKQMEYALRDAIRFTTIERSHTGTPLSNDWREWIPRIQCPPECQAKWMANDTSLSWATCCFAVPLQK